MKATKIIVNAHIVNELCEFTGYVAIDGEFITEVGEGAPSEIPAGTEIIDARGAYLLPGAIDTHVHFREPGLTHKANIASESAAAVAGGVTSFLEMPNTKPATTTMKAVEDKLAIAEKSSFANYAFFIGATNDNIDELLHADYSRVPGVKLFLGSSTGNMLVNDRGALNRLFAEYKGVIAVHAEDEETIAHNRIDIKQAYGDDAPIYLHAQLRSRDACLTASMLAIMLAKKYDSRLHLLHISTGGELDLLAEGLIDQKRITAETCPHYLLFTMGDLRAERGYVRKCNPAIKGIEDRNALLKALADNKIDVVATDHAPHLLSEKQGTLFTAASGMPGVKFMLPLMLDFTLGENPALSIGQVVEKLAHNPATLYNIDRRGFIRPGYYADLVLVEREDKPLKISDEMALSHLPTDIRESFTGCDWTPYAGHDLHHSVVATYVNGDLAYDGKTSRRVATRSLKFN